MKQTINESENRFLIKTSDSIVLFSHSPVFCCLDYAKPHLPNFKRKSLQYDNGDYNSLRHMASTTDWDSLYHTDINIYTSNITDTILNISYQLIPSKTATIRQSDSHGCTMKEETTFENEKERTTKAI